MGRYALRRDTRLGEDGFTLLEALIALAILSGAVITLITVTNSHLKTSAALSDSAQAAAIARERLEEVRLIGYSAASKKKEAPGMPDYRLDYSATEVQAGLHKICVQVSWNGNQKMDLCAHVAEKKI